MLEVSTFLTSERCRRQRPFFSGSSQVELRPTLTSASIPACLLVSSTPRLFLRSGRTGQLFPLSPKHGLPLAVYERTGSLRLLGLVQSAEPHGIILGELQPSIPRTRSLPFDRVSGRPIDFRAQTVRRAIRSTAVSSVW